MHSYKPVLTKLEAKKEEVRVINNNCPQFSGKKNQKNIPHSGIKMTGILTCLPCPAIAGLVSVWRGDAPPIPLGLTRPMRPAGRPRGVIENCL